MRTGGNTQVSTKSFLVAQFFHHTHYRIHLINLLIHYWWFHHRCITSRRGRNLGPRLHTWSMLMELLLPHMPICNLKLSNYWKVTGTINNILILCYDSTWFWHLIFYFSMTCLDCETLNLRTWMWWQIWHLMQVGLAQSLLKPVNPVWFSLVGFRKGFQKHQYDPEKGFETMLAKTGLYWRISSES